MGASWSDVGEGPTVGAALRAALRKLRHENHIVDRVCARNVDGRVLVFVRVDGAWYRAVPWRRLAARRPASVHIQLVGAAGPPASVRADAPADEPRVVDQTRCRRRRPRAAQT
jgi:hypothetical protein